MSSLKLLRKIMNDFSLTRIFINVSRVSQHIKDGKMWLNHDGKWCKYCPSCKEVVVGKDGTVTTKFNVSHSVIKNKVCHSCVKSGKPTWASLNKDKMSLLHRGKKHPMYGKHHTEEMKRKQSERYFGTKLSNGTKKKLRIAAIAQHRRNGVSFPAVDRGAKEYFDDMNAYSGFHIIHPNVEIKELGYFADGYDPVLHAIFEYDTPAHNTGRSKKKDLQRQTEIINHYNDMGNPLSAFYRINRTGFGEQGMRNILSSKTEDK